MSIPDDFDIFDLYANAEIIHHMALDDDDVAAVVSTALANTNIPPEPELPVETEVYE